MRRFLHLALIFCLVVTGIGLGIARGTVAVAGQVVLCTGNGVVVVSHPDAPGGTAAHLCPDMALSLIAAVASDPALPARADRVTALPVTPFQPVAVSRHGLSASARDPPPLRAT